MNSGRLLYTVDRAHFLTEGTHDLGIADSYPQITFEDFVVGLDIEFAYVDGEMGRYHLDEFLKNTMAVDALDMNVGKRLS